MNSIPSWKVAADALEQGPMVQCGDKKISHSRYYVGFGGRKFQPSTIQRLIDEGIAVRVGRGVASLKMLRESAAALQASTATDKEKPVA